MKEEYEKLAQAAYENSQELADEAELLMKSGGYPRACSLAVLATEEFAKSFLCRCYSMGIITDPNFRRDLADHDIKSIHFLRIIIAYLLYSRHKREIDDAFQVDSIPRNHDILKNTLDRIAEEEKRNIQNAVNVFAQADLIKQSGFYTDIDRKRVVKPREIITKQRAQTVLSYLPVIRALGSILQLDEKGFHNMVEMLDYEVTFGTIRPSVRPRKRREEYYDALLSNE